MIKAISYNFEQTCKTIDNGFIRGSDEISKKMNSMPGSAYAPSKANFFGGWYGASAYPLILGGIALGVGGSLTPVGIGMLAAGGIIGGALLTTAVAITIFGIYKNSTEPVLENQLIIVE